MVPINKACDEEKSAARGAGDESRLARRGKPPTLRPTMELDASLAPGRGWTARQRFTAACRCRPVDRPPVWLMRQAGRALPEYRALKERHSFLELVQTPELAAEVTLQPVRRFHFDAAIVFSDILVICEALGQRYAFRETGGIQMEFPVRTAADVDRLDVGAVTDRLRYVADALRLARRELGDQTALIGFAGSPWTLANFMIEGGSAAEFTLARTLFLTDRALYDRLAEKLSRAIAGYLRMQIAAGADALQVFDTLGREAGADLFDAASARWLREIVSELRGEVPVIVFSKGVNDHWDVLAGLGAQVLGVDWTVPLAGVRRQLPDHVGVQGNLDPALLRAATPEHVAAETRGLLEAMRGVRGHIVNLGHGVPPDARLENLAALANTVRGFA
jgi:uroporphyrinogen decarboxylase